MLLGIFTLRSSQDLDGLLSAHAVVTSTLGLGASFQIGLVESVCCLNISARFLGAFRFAAPIDTHGVSRYGLARALTISNADLVAYSLVDIPVIFVCYGENSTVSAMRSAWIFVM